MIKTLFPLLLPVLLQAQTAAGDKIFDGRSGAVPADSTASASQPAPAAPAATPVEPRNVILLMLDGVRWQEFTKNKPDFVLARKDKAATFPVFWSTLAAQGVVYDEMSVSNNAVMSLPAYQSIFSGFTQPCRDNDCGRITVETFPERFAREAGLAAGQVATFASWTGLALAVEHVAGATATDAGDAGKTRFDKDTFPKALDYLKAKKPRFLFISLNDSDHWGHEGEYGKYLAALRQYDAWMSELVTTLDGMGDYGRNTTLIVTTDHGRGILWDWKHHGHRPWARRVWLYARNPRSSKKGLTVSGHEHVDIRPTIETLLGLAPFACSSCGAALPEVVAP